MTDAEKTKRELLRHTLATLAYRGGKAIKGAPEDFASFKSFETTRSPGEILAHIGDLLEWALSMAEGNVRWRNSGVLSWSDESNRFFDTLKALDDYLASESPLNEPAEKLFQGPIADALTHVGQINLLRRMAESPVRGENYFKAEIETGRVGEVQSGKRVEFD